MAVVGADGRHPKFTTSSSVLKEARMSFPTWLGYAVIATVRPTVPRDITRLLVGSFPLSFDQAYLLLPK